MSAVPVALQRSAKLRSPARQDNICGLFFVRPLNGDRAIVFDMCLDDHQVVRQFRRRQRGFARHRVKRRRGGIILGQHERMVSSGRTVQPCQGKWALFHLIHLGFGFDWPEIEIRSNWTLLFDAQQCVTLSNPSSVRSVAGRVTSNDDYWARACGFVTIRLFSTKAFQYGRRGNARFGVVPDCSLCHGTLVWACGRQSHL